MNLAVELASHSPRIGWRPKKNIRKITYSTVSGIPKTIKEDSRRTITVLGKLVGPAVSWNVPLPRDPGK